MESFENSADWKVLGSFFSSASGRLYDTVGCNLSYDSTRPDQMQNICEGGECAQNIVCESNCCEPNLLVCDSGYCGGTTSDDSGLLWLWIMLPIVLCVFVMLGIGIRYCAKKERHLNQQLYG